jgi:primosomal protein N'
MKRIGVISAAALFLLFGNTARSYAQQEHQEDTKAPKEEPKAKPEKQQETKQEAKPEKQQETKQEAKPAKQQEEAKPQKQQEQPKAEKQQQATKSTKQEQQQEAKGAKQEQQAKSAKQENQQQAKAQPERQQGQHPQRSSAEEQRQRAEPALRLSARGSGRIPDDRFRANFGEGHTFVINQPVIVGGFSRFQYGGFWFGFVNPWPAEWYYTDNVYVDFIDGGYYLCNPYYPGARVSISVVI